MGSLSPLAVLDLSKFRKSEGFSGVEFKYGVLKSSSVLDISSSSLGREYILGSDSSGCGCNSKFRSGTGGKRSFDGKRGLDSKRSLDGKGSLNGKGKLW